MALGTVLDIVPLGQREKVMIDHSWSPSRIGGMAVDTIRGKTVCLVVWILGRCIIILVAANTFRRGIGIIGGGVAFCAILYIMPLGQRKKVMVNYGRPPSWIGGMAIDTICAKPGRTMIGVLR